MYKVVGKAFYEVEFEGKKYPKVRYTLALNDEVIRQRGFHEVQGPMCDTVTLRRDDLNSKPKIGDTVVVSYDVYKGQKKANGIFII